MNENTADSFTAYTSAVLTTLAFVPGGLDMKKERLKEETFNLKVKFQEMEPENEKLKNNNFWGYLLPSIKYVITMQAFQV